MGWPDLEQAKNIGSPVDVVIFISKSLSLSETKLQKSLLVHHYQNIWRCLQRFSLLMNHIFTHQTL
ncbi:MAG: hypothetical protein F6K24_14945 [Okeania sp. SIO2D1]|uniref:hypothetical protein n=1 Tax=Okeania sp. SIO2C9 TaxID=2607791 RepID=UPI0013B629D9|nr:hypothetical protein [Okeania sp. SIO2C9]NEQ74264.1 hypothetical protein [Okeania sp. SIO2C9]NES66454.1 hypothetical protein [Okeania sp. SIO2D1]